MIDNLSNSSKVVLDRVLKITGQSLTFYHGDILHAQLLDTIFSQYNIEVVIHFAGLKAVGESVAKSLMYYHNNVMGSVGYVRPWQSMAAKT